MPSVFALAIALLSPLECLPEEGTTLEIDEPIRAHLGVVVRVFTHPEFEAELRSCAHGECGVNVHRRSRWRGGWRRSDPSGLGESVVIPEAELAAHLRLPPCEAVEPQIVRTRRRPKRPIAEPAPPTPPKVAPPEPPEPAAARLAAAPPPDELLRRVASGELGGAPVGEAEVGVWRLPDVGETMALDGRVAVEVDEEGRVTFSRNMGLRGPGSVAANQSYEVLGVGPFSLGFQGQYEDPEAADPGTGDQQLARQGLPAGGAEMRGEGLNALDGVDIDAPLKRAFMAATWEARVERARAFRRRALARSMGELRGRLRAIWSADLPLDVKRDRIRLSRCGDRPREPGSGAGSEPGRGGLAGEPRSAGATMTPSPSKSR